MEEKIEERGAAEEEEDEDAELVAGVLSLDWDEVDFESFEMTEDKEEEDGLVCVESFRVGCDELLLL